MKNKAIYLIAAFLFLGLPVIERPYATVQAQKEQPALQYEVQVTLKLVQVYVTDKKGNAVLDLDKKDFILHDNGKQQELTEFEKHVLSLPPLKTELPEMIKPAPVPTPVELMSRKFFLFFDFAYGSVQGIQKARQAALHFIDTRLQPSDEVGILSYSLLKGLTVHEYLTTEHKKIREVVERFGLKDALGRAEDLEERYRRETGGEGFGDASMDLKATLHEGTGKPQLITSKDARDRGGAGKDDMVLRDDKTVASNFSRKISELAQALRYVQGHKYIIFFSAGVPSSIIYGKPPSYEPKSLNTNPTFARAFGLMSFGDNILRGKYENMCKELSASNTTVYALNTDEPSMADPIVTGALSLQQMASATGGKYFGDIRSYEQHIEKIQNLTASYYVLGYYVDEKWDGKYHKIGVDVSRPGCEVHAQGGYFNPKPYGQYSDLEKKLHLIDLALSEKPISQTPVHFPMTALACSLEKEANLCLVAKIPLEKVREISGRKVEIVNLIFDAEENIVDLHRGEEDFSRFSKENAYYYSFLSLSPGGYKCRIVIRNLETGQGAVAASSIVIPERLEKGIQLWPPLLLIPEKNALYLKGFAPEKAGGKSVSLMDYYQFDSAQYLPLLDNVLDGNSTVSAVVRCAIVDIPNPEVNFLAYLIKKSSWEKFPLTVSVLSKLKEKELEISFINLEIPELPPGAYDMNLIAQEKTSQSISYVTKTFEIR